MFKITPVVAFLLLSISTQPAFPQTATLRGTITDAQSGKTLANANIVLNSTSEPNRRLGTNSDSNGAYEIKNISTGRYILTVTFIGYTEYRQENLALSENESRLLDISLTPRVLESRPLEVVASHETIDRLSLEKLAPTASVTVLDTAQLQARHAVTAVDYLAGLPGVDVAKTGVVQSAVAVRGFNDIFASPLLLLVDNRIGRVPSLRFNAFGFLPVNNDDIARIEIVRGPAASLFGPNSANGVLHIITKTPFEAKGTTLNVGLGQNNLFTTDIRFAGVAKNRLGYKISGNFIQGSDFESHDAFEDSVRARLFALDRSYRERGLPNPDPLDENDKRIALRDFKIEKYGANARIDYRFSNELFFNLNAGFNMASNMELTDISAAVVDDWRYLYGQAKLIYKNLFAQAYINSSNSGKTYLTRDGADLVDRSKFYAFQVQNTTTLRGRQVFTYGFDAMLTRPVTEGTVNGIHEDDDRIDEFGLYLQSETDFSEKFKLVLAGRLDSHNRLDEPFFSPRAGLVYAVDPGNRLRFSYSRAFTTPTAQNLFLDRLASPLIPDRLISFSEFVQFQPFNVRVAGVPENGLSFRRDASGGIDGLYMQPVPLYFPESQNRNFLPADATLLWDKVVEIITQIQGSGLDYAFAGLQTIPAPTVSDVASVLKLFNASTGEFNPVDPAVVSDIRGLESTKTTSFEIGYKSVAKSGLLLDVAFYYNRIRDYTGPLLLETPNVFFDRQSLQNFLIAQDALAPGAELDRRSAAIAFARMIAQIPLGTVVPNESRYPGDLMLTYRNFGDIGLWGLDLDFAYTPSAYFTLDGNFSHVSKDFFQNEDGVRDIALNAPQNKFSLGLQAKSPITSVFFGMRFRHVDQFPVSSGVFVGTVPAYNIFDFNAGIDLPGETGIRLMLTVQNLFDKKHIEFTGAPEIGRLAMLHFKYFPDRFGN